MLKKSLTLAGKLLVAPALLLIVSPSVSSAQNQCPIQQAKMAAARKTMNVSIAAPAEKDIVDTAVGAGSFNTLVAAVKAAGLVETLKGEGPFTVLAPTDKAFKKLPKGTVETLLKPENLKALQGILTYHVIPGSVMAADVVKLTSAKTVQGDPVTIKVTDGGVMINGAKVVTTDIKCSNGVIHVIDSVILPPKKADIVDTAVGAGAFNTLVAAGAIEKFVSPGEAGGQTWIYVQAGEAIARGEAVMLDATAGGKMVALKATDASKVIGVAQWNIPNTNFAWVLCQGVGKVLSGGAIAQGDLLATTTGAAAVAGAGVVTYGHALELTGVAALIDASIHSLG